MKKIFRILILFTILSSLNSCAMTGNREKSQTTYKRKTDRTYVFTDIQPKYVPGRNYLVTKTWYDRPLSTDSSLGNPNSLMTEEEFLAIAENMRKTGIDGTIWWCNWPGKLNTGKLALKYSDKAGLKDFYIPVGFYGRFHRPQYRTELLKTASESPHGMKVNGKLLVTGYLCDLDKPEYWKKEIPSLEKKSGADILFLPSIGVPPRHWYQLNHDYRVNGKVSKEHIEELKAHIRKYLDVADGVAINFILGQMRNMDNRKFNTEFYRDFVIPTFVSVLSEPAYKDKYLALSAKTGYYNPESNRVADEDGTKQLRESFEAAMSANPDFILLPEWNELNENSFFAPTVYNSWSTQRIVNYYMNKIKGQKQSPFSGDDTSLPNLIISYRKNLPLGVPLNIELLNVPDSDSDEKYSVRLFLEDAKGKTVKSFPPVEFVLNEMKDKTWSIPTEELAAYPVLRPCLEIKDYKGKDILFSKGLHHIYLNPTWDRNKKYVKQPLRDILKPNVMDFEVKELKNGKVKVAALVECNEALKSVEVVKDGYEIYAAGLDKVFPDREKNVVIKLSFDGVVKDRSLRGKVTVENVDEIKVIPFDRHNSNNHFFRFRGGNTIDIEGNILNHGRWRAGFYICVPKRLSKKAVIKIDCDKLKTDIKLADVLKKGEIARVQGRGVSVIAGISKRLAMLPPPLNEKKVDFSVELPRYKTGHEPELYHLRAITVSGKIFRSPPVLVSKKKSGEKVSVDIFSFSKNGVVKVELPKERVPKFSYDFSAGSDAFLCTEMGSDWYGKLGIIEYNDPFKSLKKYPKDALVTSPEFVTEEGRKCLKFDGKGNFVFFPRETLPDGAFTLTMEIKPMSEKKQYLLASFCHSPGGLNVWMDNGRIYGEYVARKPGPKDRNVFFKTFRLDPQISLPIGKWSKLEITYDLKNFVFKVDGKAGKPCPCDQKTFAAQLLVFGGFENEFFEGYLSSFKIQHWASAK